MVELIDKAFGWMIVNAPSWKITTLLMHYRHSWYSKWRKWNDEQKKWVKV